jgi:hypothetical protein
VKNVMLATHGQEFFAIVYHLNNNGGTLREFKNAVEAHANNFETDDVQNKFKGDCLEILAELFFNKYEADPSVGLKEYTPVIIGNDYGVDATGTNANNQKVAVQIKYRSNPADLVTYEEIAKTYTSGELSLNLDLKKENSIYVFTNSNDVTHSCKYVFGDRLVILNRDIISGYIDNNATFWNYAYNEVYNYLN